MDLRQGPQILNHCNCDIQSILPFALRTLDEKQVYSITKRKPKEEDDFEEEKELLYCTYCLNLITSGDQRIQMGGSHEHTFINPAGVAFNIGCFRETPGTVFEGIPTEEFTWFKGYQWRMAHCSECLMHIGWQYLQGSHGSFSGLILTRLTVKKK